MEILREIAESHGFEFTALSNAWILQIRDRATGRQCSVFGYTFDTNSAGVVEICNDKAAASLVLAHHGVPAIPHTVFLSPAHQKSVDYIPRTGNWNSILELARSYDNKLVLKPLAGTGGIGVMRATSQAEVERACQLLFEEDYGLAVWCVR